MRGFDPADPRNAGPELSADAVLPVGDRGRYPFLTPPREPGEFGWLGDYRVLRVLGFGGMGVVFEAEDTVLHRPVALKVLRPDLGGDPESRERFLREARAAAGLLSDHIVTVYQVGETGSVPYLVMEFLHGESLQTRIERQSRLDVSTAVTIARDTAAGLAAAHARGMIHRDIKPANLWLESDGPGGRFRRVKILDFGLARRARGETSLTATGLVVGTPHYMAPEQASGLELDQRADLFSLGCVLYTILAGELPFKGDSAMAVMMALASKTPSPLTEKNPAVPLGVSNLVARLMAKDRSARPHSASEVGGMLDAVLSGLPPRIPTPPTGLTPAPSVPGDTIVRDGMHTPIGGTTASLRPPLPPAESALPGLWQIVRAVAVLAVVALVILVWRMRRPDPPAPPSANPPAQTGALPQPRGPESARVYWGSTLSQLLRDWADS